MKRYYNSIEDASRPMIRQIKHELDTLNLRQIKIKNNNSTVKIHAFDTKVEGFDDWFDLNFKQYFN